MMAEELSENLKISNDRSINEKIEYLTDILDKAIQYYNYVIEDITEHFRAIELRLSILEKKGTDSSSPAPPPPSTNYGIRDRNAVLEELKDLFKKRRDIDH